MTLTITSQLLASKNQKMPEPGPATTTLALPVVPVPGGPVRQVALMANFPCRQSADVVEEPQENSAGGPRTGGMLPMKVPLCAPRASLGLNIGQTATRPGWALRTGTLIVDRIWSWVRATFHRRTSLTRPFGL